MMSVQLAAAGLFAAYLVFKVLYARLLSPLRHLPVTPQSPVFKRLLKEPDSTELEKWSNEVPNNGFIQYRGILNGPRVLITKPEGIKQMLQIEPYSFIKTPAVQKIIAAILGNGLVVAEGEAHKNQRKALQPAFKYKHIKDLYPTFWTKAGDFLISLDKMLATSSTNAIDVLGPLGRPALDIVGLAGFGLDFGSVADPDNDLTSNYLVGFSASKSAQRRRLLALILPKWLLNNLPLKRNQELANAVMTVRNAATSLIEKRQKYFDDEKAVPDEGLIDILGTTMRFGVRDTEELTNQSMTFLGAGQETTTSALSWAMYRLSLPESQAAQDRLRKEVRTHLPSPTSKESPITAEDIDNLPYLTAICNEILRLHPPVPMLHRVNIKPVTISNQVFPKGTNFRVSIYAMNHSPEYWSSDPTIFNPTRWLADEGGDAKGGAKDLYAYNTFSHGPRSCIGEKFARGEMAAILAAVVGRYKVTFVGGGEKGEDGDVEAEHGITMKIMGGLWVKLEKVDGW